MQSLSDGFTCMYPEGFEGTSCHMETNCDHGIRQSEKTPVISLVRINAALFPGYLLKSRETRLKSVPSLT